MENNIVRYTGYVSLIIIGLIFIFADFSMHNEWFVQAIIKIIGTGFIAGCVYHYVQFKKLPKQ